MSWICPAGTSSGTPKDKDKDRGGGSEEDDIAVLSRRISQAAMSDDSSVSAADNNYDSDASRDGMADMEDNDVTNSLQMVDEEDSNTHSNDDRQGQLCNVLLVIPPASDHLFHHPFTGEEDERMDEKYLQQEVDNLSVYIARYSYDPYQHSPNENPDAELAFQAGDYLYVFGDVDDVSMLP